jgi:hypothetical protein
LTLTDRFLERDFEDAILRELETFLLELGAGFSFVARQKRIQLDGDDFYIDLLFYNRKLKRLVAVVIKQGGFKPEYKGQMELYPSGDTSKPANEGHLKTGQWKQAGRVLYTRLWSAKARKSSACSCRVELHCEDLSGGYGNVGMRPERRLSGPERTRRLEVSDPSRLVWQAFLARKR